jgi:4-hydroxy-3-polyprenylbenzoate decarboxylase
LKYKDLRDFISQLEKNNDLKRIDTPVSSSLEMTEISDRVLKAEGPALIFQHAMHEGKKSDMPVHWRVVGEPARARGSKGL